MRRDYLHDLDDTLGEGFFADRLVEVISRYGPLDAETQTVLERALRQLQQAIDGQDTVYSGKLSSNALESIHAYNTALQFAIAATQPSDQFGKQFRDFIKAITEEIQTTLKQGEMHPDRMSNTLSYYEAIRRATLERATNFFREGVNPPAWSRVTH